MSAALLASCQNEGCGATLGTLVMNGMAEFNADPEMVRAFVGLCPVAERHKWWTGDTGPRADNWFVEGKTA